MNQVLPERRARKRTEASANIELIAGETRIPAQLLNISFGGLMGRVAREDIDAYEIEAVKLEGLPSLGIKVEWAGNEVFGASFSAPDKAGKVIAGFIEIFVPPKT